VLLLLLLLFVRFWFWDALREINTLFFLFWLFLYEEAAIITNVVKISDPFMLLAKEAAAKEWLKILLIDQSVGWL